MAGLDRWKRLQNSQFGTSSSLRSGPGTPQTQAAAAERNATGEAYRRAARLLKRQARRGNAAAALDEIKVRETANAAGYRTSGIVRSEEKNAGLMSTMDSMLRSEDALRRGASAMSGAVRDQVAPTSPGSVAPSPLAQAASSFTAAPTPDSQLGYRQAIDAELGSLPADSGLGLEALRMRAADAGVSDEQFDRRARWWERRRGVRY